MIQPIESIDDKDLVNLLQFIGGLLYCTTKERRRVMIDIETGYDETEVESNGKLVTSAIVNGRVDITISVGPGKIYDLSTAGCKVEFSPKEEQS